MLAGLGLGELEAGAAGDDLEAVVDVAAEQLLEGHDLGAAMIDGEHVGAEGGLELGVLVEVVEDDLREGAALEFDDDADAVAGAFVADVGDAFDDLLVDEVGHLLDHAGLVHRVGDLGDDDGLFVLVFDDLGLAAHDDGAAAELVHGLDGAGAADGGAGGEVGALDELHEVVDGAVGVVDVMGDPVHEFAEVVGRDVGGHADGDAADRKSVV